jgi:Uma2 family endonuclease
VTWGTRAIKMNVDERVSLRHLQHQHIAATMSTIVPLMTADQLGDLPDDGHRYDLLRGELLKMSPAGRGQGRIAIKFGRLFDNFVVEHNLGETYAAETGFLLSTDPDTVLAPDVSFISRERLPKIQGVSGFIPIPPDLAVEVISPSDRLTQVEDKVIEWLNAGTKVVITLNPRKSVARIYRSPKDMQTLSADDTLELPDIAPGWSISLSELFQL